MKQMPQFDLEINVTQALINKFISGKTALSDEDYFTVITDGDNAKLVIGYASVNTNRVTIPVTTNKSSDIKNISFNANLFKEVLTANKDYKNLLILSGDGVEKKIFNLLNIFSVTSVSQTLPFFKTVVLSHICLITGKS